MSSASRMTMSASATTTSLLLSFFLCITYVLAGDQNDYYSELPLPSTGRVALSEDHVKTPRLLDLLQLKQSMSDLLPSNSGSDNSDDDKLDDLGVSKRVFCNGFTGCGGRFRGRRRHDQPPVGKRMIPMQTKRPFCNSYGCYNNGKKRSSTLGSELREDAAQMANQKIMAFDDGWSGEKIKKLFCNGYGGCQNMGKRLALLDAELARDVSGDDEGLLPFSNTKSDKFKGSKRFFTSSFDSDVDSLIDSMRR